MHTSTGPSPDPILLALASAELFTSLDTDAIHQLSRVVEPVRVPGGEVLFNQGDVADCLYVVASGRLRVSLETAAGAERVLGEAGRGDTLGEMALLTGEPRSASVRAVRDSVLLRLRKSVFDRLVEQHPALMLHLTRRMVQRYQATLASPASGERGGLKTLALVPVAPGVPLAGFAERLAAALEAQGPVLRLTSARLDAVLGPGASRTPQDHARNGEIVGWLNEQEANYRTILYETDPTRTAWTNRCIRQADRILLVAADDGSPAPGPIELGMQREGTDNAGVQKELVLLHREKRDRYPGTQEWLRPRRVDRHHHVVLDVPGDVARLVRILTGTATGVVLGGGGARAFAQVGVLRALREAGVEIDMIGGTSMGAFLAAQYALGWDPERMHAFNRHAWTRLRPMRDYTLPYVGLITGQKFIRIARELYGEANVEDLGIRYFCCSSNITRARLMVHERGPIWRWLSATIAVPGISPPLFDGGDLLVDGAVLDNLPIDVMRRICDGTVVAVDVSPVEDLAIDAEYRMCPSSWQILANRMNPFADRLRIPSIFEILSRVVSLSSVQQLEQMKSQADLFLHPPIEPFSMFDFDRIDELVELGHRHAQQALAAWTGGTPARTLAGTLPRRRPSRAVDAVAAG